MTILVCDYSLVFFIVCCCAFRNFRIGQFRHFLSTILCGELFCIYQRENEKKTDKNQLHVVALLLFFLNVLKWTKLNKGVSSALFIGFSICFTTHSESAAFGSYLRSLRRPPKKFIAIHGLERPRRAACFKSTALKLRPWKVDIEKDRQDFGVFLYIFWYKCNFCQQKWLSQACK